MTPPLITLTTDFGTCDPFVGIMKGVILNICPHARLVDLSHQIAPQDVFQAAWMIQSSLPWFPTKTIHLAVVDPGVGTTRMPVAIKTPQATFVGPDNGLFGLVWKDANRRWTNAKVVAVELSEPSFFLPEISSTFHGRDIFAPVAAHLARGIPLHALGRTITTIQPTQLSEPKWKDPRILQGQVGHVDRFGNCITNISTEHLHQLGPTKKLQVLVAGEPFGSVCNTYSDVPLGSQVALVGSTGYLELALREGNLSQAKTITRETTVQIHVGLDENHLVSSRPQDA